MRGLLLGVAAVGLFAAGASGGYLAADFSQGRTECVEARALADRQWAILDGAMTPRAAGRDALRRLGVLADHHSRCFTVEERVEMVAAGEIVD